MIGVGTLSVGFAFENSKFMIKIFNIDEALKKKTSHFVTCFFIIIIIYFFIV